MKYYSLVLNKLTLNPMPGDFQTFVKKGLRPKSHMILIEIKKAARYLRKNSQTPQVKNREKTDQIHMAFGPLTSCFSVERNFNFYLPIFYKLLFTSILQSFQKITLKTLQNPFQFKNHCHI